MPMLPSMWPAGIFENGKHDSKCRGTFEKGKKKIVNTAVRLKRVKKKLQIKRCKNVQQQCCQ